MEVPAITEEAVQRGAAVYSRPVLAIYDAFVLGFTNSFVWKCPSSYILDFYNQNVSEKHLDVGVGSGWFLDHCTFPSARPQISLMDLNENSLQKTARRLGRYAPVSYRRNVLAPIDISDGDFGSIGLGYLLHCLPGDMSSKQAVFENLRPLLRKEGVIFGTTIVADTPRNWMAHTYMRIFNAVGVFSNRADGRDSLARAIGNVFPKVEVTTRGNIGFFRACK